MIDDERTAPEGDEQAGTDIPKDTLEDLDVTTDDGADVKGGVPKEKEYEFGSDKPTNCQ